MSATKKKPRARRPAYRGAVDRIADLGTAALQLAATEARQNVHGLVFPMPARDLAAYVKNLANEHDAAREGAIGESGRLTMASEHHRRAAVLLHKIADAIADGAGGRPRDAVFHLHHEDVLSLLSLGATRPVMPYEINAVFEPPPPPAAPEG